MVKFLQITRDDGLFTINGGFCISGVPNLQLRTLIYKFQTYSKYEAINAVLEIFAKLKSPLESFEEKLIVGFSGEFNKDKLANFNGQLFDIVDAIHFISESLDKVDNSNCIRVVGTINIERVKRNKTISVKYKNGSFIWCVMMLIDETNNEWACVAEGHETTYELAEKAANRALNSFGDYN